MTSATTFKFPTSPSLLPASHLHSLRNCNQFQRESSSRFTSTDTDVIFNHQHGIPSALVSLPLRYMHSVVEMADLRDVEQVIHLLTSLAESISETDEFKVKL